MKKIVLSAVLALSAVAASAMEVTGAVKYDYDRFEAASGALSSHRATASLAGGFGKLGTMDVGLVTAQAQVTGDRVNLNGVEVGYSNGTKVGPVELGGRLGFTQYNTGRIAGLSARADVLSVAGTVELPLTSKLSVVGGVEHLRADLSGDLDGKSIANRSTVGVEYAVSKNVSVQGLYARTRSEGENANGLTAVVRYKF